MGKKQTNTSTAMMSRRTGIDRRWITSPGYSPERRSGKDRRLTHYRSFLEPIESIDQKSSPALFLNDHFCVGAIGMRNSEDDNPEQSLSRIPEESRAENGKTE